MNETPLYAFCTRPLRQIKPGASARKFLFPIPNANPFLNFDAQDWQKWRLKVQRPISLNEERERAA